MTDKKEPKALVKACAEKHTREAIDTLHKIMKSEKAPAAARIAAANAILDRAHGKPHQSVEAKVDASVNIQLVDYSEFDTPAE